MNQFLNNQEDVKLEGGKKKWDFAVRITTKARLKANISKFCSLLLFFFFFSANVFFLLFLSGFLPVWLTSP